MGLKDFLAKNIIHMIWVVCVHNCPSGLTFDSDTESGVLIPNHQCEENSQVKIFTFEVVEIWGILPYGNNIYLSEKSKASYIIKG